MPRGGRYSLRGERGPDRRGHRSGHSRPHKAPKEGASSPANRIQSLEKDTHQITGTSRSTFKVCDLSPDYRTHVPES